VEEKKQQVKEAQLLEVNPALEKRVSHPLF